MTGLLTQQLEARKAYKDADDAVRDALKRRDEAREAIREAEAEFYEAQRLAGLASQKRGNALEECKRLGIEP